MRPRLPSTLIIVASAACLAAILWQIWQAPETYPQGDTATTSIYTLRAVKGELATGAYSRFQWHHPGPLLYELLAPLYALSGRREVSLKWSMLLFNVAVLAALLTYLSRHSKWLCGTTAIAALPLIFFEQRLLFWPWNPVAPLLALALAMALAAGVCAGDVASLPWLLGVASFVVQSHVGLAPVTLLLTAAAVVAVIWRLRSRRDDHRAVRRAVIASAIVGVLLWSVPVFHDFHSGTSNLAGIARSVLSSHDVRPWAQVRDIVANELVATFNPSRELITGEVPTSAGTSVRVWAVVQLILLAVVGVHAHRRGHLFVAAFGSLCVLSSVMGLFTVRSIPGELLDYLVIWIGIIGMLNVAVLLSAIGLLLPSLPLPSRTTVSWRAGIGAWLIVIAALGVTRLNWKQRADASDHTVAHLAGDFAQYCDARHYVRPLFTFDWKIWHAAAGVVLELYKEDRAVSVADDARFMFGEPFARTGSEPAELHLMSVEGQTMPVGVTRFTWITTFGDYRLVQVWRD